MPDQRRWCPGSQVRSGPGTRTPYSSPLGGVGDVLPVGPGLEALGVDLLDDLRGLGAEEDPQGRVVGVDDLEQGGAGSGWVAEGGAGVGFDQGLADVVVDGVGFGVARRGPGPVGREAAGLDEGDVDAGAGELLGQRLGEAFEGHLEAWYPPREG